MRFSTSPALTAVAAIAALSAKVEFAFQRRRSLQLKGVAALVNEAGAGGGYSLVFDVWYNPANSTYKTMLWLPGFVCVRFKHPEKRGDRLSGINYLVGDPVVPGYELPSSTYC